jgi:hypothetical protein
MEEQKPKSIRTIGIFVAVLSGLIIFFNSSGALVYTLTGMNSKIAGTSNGSLTGTDPMEFMFRHYTTLCLITVTVGILLLIGSIYLIKFRIWANRLISIMSIFLILSIWGIMIAFSFAISRKTGSKLLCIFPIFNALLWSTPFGLLIWHLNQEKVKKHFV